LLTENSPERTFGHPTGRRTTPTSFRIARAADLWVQASLEQRQRFQQLFFPDGIAFDGKRFVRTSVTAPFSYLREIENENAGLVAQIFARWNPLTSWMRQIDRFRIAV
jgi:hypothetical protein